MIKPASLSQGDTVSIVAPGRKLDRTIIDAATKILENWGLTVRTGKNLFSEKHNYLSGTDTERLEDLQQALNDSSIKAIICARGGYGTTRILDQLDFTAFTKNPKWICGFSDITALHLKLQSLNVQSIHGTMPIQFADSMHTDSAEQLRSLLFGEAVSIQANPSSQNRLGEATGEMVGGNLSLLLESLGTTSELQTENKILIIEEVGEYVYRLDRMLVQLKRAGKLNLAGLVIGHMTDIQESELPFGERVEQLVRYHTQDFNYPIAFNFPTGHDHPNLAWISGAKAKLEVTNTKSLLRF